MKHRIMVLTVGLLCVGLFMGGTDVFGSSHGYEFRNLNVSDAATSNIRQPDKNPSQREVRVDFQVSWQADSFPGTRLCEWIVYDSSGDIIGRSTSTLTSMEATQDPVYKDMQVEPGRELGESSVTCEPRRLDDPSGTFEFSDVSVQTPSASLASDLDVLFSHAWHGDGTPTPQRCEIDIIAESGERLFTSVRNFHSVGTAPMSSNFSLEAPQAFTDYDFTSATATIRCAPIS